MDPVTGQRVDRGLVDLTARTGYSMVGAKPSSPHARAAEYLQVRDAIHFNPASSKIDIYIQHVISLIGNTPIHLSSRHILLPHGCVLSPSENSKSFVAQMHVR